MSHTNSPPHNQAMIAAGGAIALAANPILAAHANAIRELGRRTFKNIIAIGRHLAESREELGEWLVWLEDEFAWSGETARRFINVFTLCNDAKFHTCVELDQLPLAPTTRRACGGGRARQFVHPSWFQHRSSSHLIRALGS